MSEADKRLLTFLDCEGESLIHALHLAAERCEQVTRDEDATDGMRALFADSAESWRRKVQELDDLLELRFLEEERGLA